MSAGQAIGCAVSTIVIVAVGALIVGLGYDALRLVGPSLGQAVPVIGPLVLMGAAVGWIVRRVGR